MLKLCRFTKVKVFFLVLVSVFNFDLFEFSAAIWEKGLLINTAAYALRHHERKKCLLYFMSTFTSTQAVRFFCRYVASANQTSSSFSVRCSGLVSLSQQNYCFFTWIEEVSRKPNVVVRPHIISIRC